MRIKRTQLKKEFVPFKSLSKGDPFSDDTGKYIYMKTEGSYIGDSFTDCVNLLTGAKVFLPGDVLVVPLDAEITIYDEH